MLLKLQWLTDIFDWLHHNWERAHVQRKVALVIFWVYVAALCCVELKRQGMLPPALAQLTPHSHFSAIQLAFTLILGLEVMSLIFIISTSFSRSVGKQFEILALILLRNAFKELAHLPEPVSIAGNLDPVIHIAVTALGALGIFVALGIYGKLASSYAYIQSPEMRMRFVISKKLLSLTLFVIFLGIGIRDAWIHIHTGEDMRFFETIYTVLIFADIALVLISQRYMPSFHAVFRNSGFVIGTLMMLVPGLPITNAMRDIIYGDTNSGIFRLVQVVFTALAIALGTAAAWHLTSGVYGVTGSATVTWQPLAQAVAVFVGCLGFCILFNVHGRGSVLCIIGGVVTWMLYLLGGALGCDVYVANLFASLFAAAYAEVMARVRKCPAMPYLVIAILPLLPGAGVYYTMSLGLEGNRMDAVAKGLETVGIAGSLAVGILLVSTVFRLIYRHVQGARAEKS